MSLEEAFNLWQETIDRGWKFPSLDYDGTGSRKGLDYRCKLGPIFGYGATAEEAVFNAHQGLVEFERSRDVQSGRATQGNH